MKVIDFANEKKNRTREGSIKSSIVEKKIKIKEIVVGNTEMKDKCIFTTVNPNNIEKPILRKTKPFKMVLMVVVLMMGGICAKKICDSFKVYADVEESYVTTFNRGVEEKYLKELESLSVASVGAPIGEEGVASMARMDNRSSQSYFNVDKICNTFTEEVKGKNSTYTVTVSLSIPVDKISVTVSDVIDVVYNKEDIEIASVEIEDSFNREYLGSIKVNEKTVKEIEEIIEEEKESIMEKVYSKSKQDFMSIIDEAIKESINI